MKGKFQVYNRNQGLNKVDENKRLRLWYGQKPCKMITQKVSTANTTEILVGFRCGGRENQAYKGKVKVLWEGHKIWKNIPPFFLKLLTK